MCEAIETLRLRGIPVAMGGEILRLVGCRRKRGRSDSSVSHRSLPNLHPYVASHRLWTRMRNLVDLQQGRCRRRSPVVVANLVDLSISSTYRPETGDFKHASRFLVHGKAATSYASPWNPLRENKIQNSLRPMCMCSWTGPKFIEPDAAKGSSGKVQNP